MPRNIARPRGPTLLHKVHTAAIHNTFDAQQEQAGVARLLRTLGDLGIEYRDLQTRESSLEEIFVGLVHE